MSNRLYVHVPFCMQKCHYCAFVSGIPHVDELAEYSELLIRELQLRCADAAILASIYFGGGTPSLLQPQQVNRLLDAAAVHIGIESNAEITLEANPGTVDDDSLKSFRAAGINRVSLGVQSFDDRFLEVLGRAHTAEQSLKAFGDIRAAGFANVSIDLIHSLPNQSPEQWRSELQHAINLNPEHISVYGLTVEDGTHFAQIYPAGSPLLADDDHYADMFEMADTLLTEAGYEHYEIASFARPGYRSQHNSGYWKRDSYLGLGVAAHSFLCDGYGLRFSNVDTLEEYRQAVKSGNMVPVAEHRLTGEEAMAEYFFLGLRLSEGVSLSAYEHEFGRLPEPHHILATAELVRAGLLEQNNDVLTLTKRGVLLSNQVFGKYL